MCRKGGPAARNPSKGKVRFAVVAVVAAAVEGGAAAVVAVAVISRTGSSRSTSNNKNPVLPLLQPHHYCPCSPYT